MYFYVCFRCFYAFIDVFSVKAEIEISRLKEGIRTKCLEISPESRTHYRYSILLTDSKGHTLKKACPKNCFPFDDLWAIVGGQSETLVDLAIFRLRTFVHRQGKIALYVWSGTCDITQKEDKGHNIFPRYKDQSRSLRVVQKQFQRLVDYASQFSEVTLKFVEIPYISTTLWNGDSAPDNSIQIDKGIETQVRSINLNIRQLNLELGQNTLHLAHDCMNCRRPKSKNKPNRYTVTYRVLQDGDQSTLDQIFKKLQLDILKTCHQDPDILDLTLRSDELNLLE